MTPRTAAQRLDYFFDMMIQCDRVEVLMLGNQEMLPNFVPKLAPAAKRSLIVDVAPPPWPLDLKTEDQGIYQSKYGGLDLSQSKITDHSHCLMNGPCSLTRERSNLAPFCICSWWSWLITAGILSIFFTMAVEGSYLTELLTEKDNLDPSFVHSMRLLTEGR